MTDNVQNLRNKAADLIEEHGWTQNTYSNSEGCLCLVGALAAARVGYDQFVAADPDLQNVVADDVAILETTQLLPIDVSSAIEWNDMEGRTQDEVVAALRGTL